jgi:hypothetical protein
MATKNPITGDEIKSKCLSKQGRDNWDNIFKKQSAFDWLKEFGYPSNCIISPSGWMQGDGVSLDTPISRSDFFQRFNSSTINLPLNIINESKTNTCHR